MSNQTERVLDALGDASRRRILELLATGARPVGAMAAELPIGRPAVSKHLRVLEDAGLVRHESRGTRNVYALAPEGPRAARRWLEQTWDAALGAFAEYVDQHGAARNRTDEEER
jgi:DNA-binding transcriptional ArsR family regulator